MCSGKSNCSKDFGSMLPNSYRFLGALLLLSKRSEKVQKTVTESRLITVKVFFFLPKETLSYYRLVSGLVRKALKSKFCEKKVDVCYLNEVY